jgi:uncharacterized protein (DUF4415 family)
MVAGVRVSERIGRVARKKVDEWLTPMQRLAKETREEQLANRQAEIKAHQDLLELEMFLADMKYAEKRRAAWPKAWGGVEEAFPTIPPKTQITMKLDADLVAWFRKQGRGYQARMNAVLRAYMLTRKTGFEGSA